jgi:hypothetical protein
MDRVIVYPGSIPLDTDMLSSNRNTMIAIGYLAQAILGTDPVVEGLACIPTSPPSLTVAIGPGCITQLSVVDALAYGSLPSGTADLVKMGINLSPVQFTMTAPTTSGQAVNYLIQAALQESDTNPVILPFYNAANPSQPFAGPGNSGASQPTRRSQRVQLQFKAGAPALAGAQSTPPVDTGWVGLYVVTVAYGQSAIASNQIVRLPGAPFAIPKLPSLKPGFGSGVQSFTNSGIFVVPERTTVVEVEVWGGGAGSFASVPNLASGGGSGGGYARKRVTNLIPGQAIPVTVGGGGAAGTVAGASAGPGGSSSFGSYVSATGGGLNPLATIADPRYGATPSGLGSGGDTNLSGSAGQAGVLNQGGMGGAAPMGGTQNSGTTGKVGLFPGGGAAGAGTGADSATRYDGAAGAPGLVIVRW